MASAGYGVGGAAGGAVAGFTATNGGNARKPALRTQGVACGFAAFCAINRSYMCSDIAYAWEQAYERSWEAVEEDEEGRLKQPVTEASLHRSRRFVS